MTIAEKLTRAKADIDAVYEAGKASGSGSGDSYYDEFWDVYQENGNRNQYIYAFCGLGWNDETFNPKYKVNCGNNTMYMFAGTRIENLDTSKLNTSYVVRFSNMFAGNTTVTTTKHIIGIFDMSSATQIDYIFNYCTRLEVIDLLKFPSNPTQITGATNAFQKCEKLREIRIDGVIGVGLDFKWSVDLSADSLKSIVEHLSDSVTGQTLTLPTTAESTYNAKYGEGAWATLIAPIINWTFAYQGV